MGILGRSPSRAEKKLRGLWSGCRKGCAPVQVSKGRGTAEELCARQVWAPQGVRRPDASRLQLRCWSSGDASLGVPVHTWACGAETQKREQARETQPSCRWGKRQGGQEEGPATKSSPQRMKENQKCDVRERELCQRKEGEAHAPQKQTRCPLCQHPGGWGRGCQ